ncbi:DUF4279 domain-containing protein [Massilia sp. DWR3-1-1]|uniref:DUF4279 domain-containing protein n=1 Tax=Massilia sp. DWR3-1-1 TaxID=2804559 RepID=UPI003CEE10F7
MAQIHHSAACLRLFGEDLDPEEVSRILRCAPTVAERTGEVIPYQSGRERVVKCGNWRLIAEQTAPEDVNGQLRWLLSQVESDLAVWKSLVHQFEVDVYCGLFMQGLNDGLSLAPDVMALLAERGIELGLDIYSANVEDDATPAPANL